MFSSQLLDHFQNPRNPGQLANPDASVQLENPVCGDILRLTLRIEDGRIARIAFLAKGCVAAMACASALTELVQGLSLGMAREVTQRDLKQAVGGLPDASEHASQLALNTLRAALDLARNVPKMET